MSPAYLGRREDTVEIRGGAKVGQSRGNLNQACIYLKEKEKSRLTISVEYYLEYQATGFEPRIPIC